MGEKGNTHKILVGEHEKWITIRRLNRRWYFIKMDLKQICYYGADWINLAQ